MVKWYKERQAPKPGDPNWDYYVESTNQYFKENNITPKPGDYGYDAYIYSQERSRLGLSEKRERSDTVQSENIDMEKVSSPVNKQPKTEPTMEPVAKAPATM